MAQQKIRVICCLQQMSRADPLIGKQSTSSSLNFSKAINRLRIVMVWPRLDHSVTKCLLLMNIAILSVSQLIKTQTLLKEEMMMGLWKIKIKCLPNRNKLITILCPEKTWNFLLREQENSCLMISAMTIELLMPIAVVDSHLTTKKFFKCSGMPLRV